MKVSVKGSSAHRGAQIVLKFHDFVELSDNIKNENYLNEIGAGDWLGLKKEFPGIVLSKMITAVKDKDLELLQRKAAESDHSYVPVNFKNYFFINCPANIRAEALLEVLNKWKSIEKAYVDYPVPDPLVDASNDPRAANQHYLDAAPTGIDARYAWGFPGGDGAGVAFVDMERGWTFNHEDLAAHGITQLGGVLLDSSRAHGTSVLGEICAVDNTLGCVGITPNVSSVRTVSYNGSTRPDAIVTAISNMVFGDVLILEAQVTVPGTATLLGPCEVLDADFDAIRLATALGIIVVEAGGNGTNNGSTPPFDLDAYINPSGKRQLFRDAGNADFKDSGAIIVSASSSAAPHTRLAWAPHGKRIDCYAWGENINTLSSSNAGATNLYTTGFGGTSGASPIITGAAIAVQGLHQNSFSFRLSPRQMRKILSDPANGTLPAAAETTAFGVMPNLRHIIDSVLNISQDVYLRDHIGDNGDPHNGAVSVSPDIILSKTDIANPQASFGAGSGTENDAFASPEAEIGQDNFVYVRMQNRGGANATNVKADVYWAPPSTLLTPDLWHTLGSVTVPSVPAGNILTVSNKITWPSASIPAIGHYCFVGILGNDKDPAPQPADFVNWNNFVTFIKNNNNVTWKNFNVVNNDPSVDPSVPKEFFALPFLTPGALDKNLIFDLELVSRLPIGSRVLLELPTAWGKKLELTEVKVDYKHRRGYSTYNIKNTGKQLLPRISMAAKSKTQLRLFISIPKKFRNEVYQIAVRQVWEQQEVGRIGWTIMSAEQKKKLENRFK